MSGNKQLRCHLLIILHLHRHPSELKRDIFCLFSEVYAKELLVKSFTMLLMKVCLSFKQIFHTCIKSPLLSCFHLTCVFGIFWTDLAAESKNNSYTVLKLASVWGIMRTVGFAWIFCSKQSIILDLYVTCFCCVSFHFIYITKGNGHYWCHVVY